MGLGERLWGAARRALALLVSVLALSAAVFCAARLAPGDPLAAYYGQRTERLSPEERARAEERLGLGDPLYVQYARWLGGALRGQFGLSLRYRVQALEVIGGRLGNTLLLGGTAFVLIFLLALPLGAVCARYEGRWPDRLVRWLGAVSGCVPQFWLALVLILLFSVRLGLLPSGGAYPPGEAGSAAGRLRHLALPLAVLVEGHLWYYACMLRDRLVEETRADYVAYARAKGLGRWGVLFGHCLKNCLPAYLSLMAVSVPHMMGETFIVEAVFAYPGVGALAYESARDRDVNVLMAVCLLSGTAAMVCSLAARWLGGRMDPRLRAGGEEADRRGG